MASISFTLTFLVILFFRPGSATNMVDYIVSVIQHLEDFDPGVARLVFYGTAPKNPFDNHVGAVLNDSRIEFTTKFVITGDKILNNDQLPAKPSLLLIQGDIVEEWKHVQLFKQLLTFDPSTKVIVLTDLLSKSFAIYMEVFKEYMKYNNAVFLDAHNNCTVILNVLEIVTLYNFLEPERLIKRYPMQNIRGKPIRFSLKRSISESFPFIKWLEETASYMNTTVREIPHACKVSAKDDNVLEKCYANHLMSNKVDFDAWIYSAKRVEKQFFSSMFTCLTQDIVVLAPRFPINTFQIFTMPFQWTVWITILVLFITLEVVKCSAPSTFRNDPILLVLCGYEKCNLHKSKYVEKLVLFPFIVLAFFITSAYETKIISFMVHRPATQEFKTFQDLAQAKVKIKYDPRSYTLVTEEKDIQGLLLQTNDSLFNLDLSHAYIADRSLSEVRLIPLHYDPVNKMYRYNIMEQSLGLLPVSFRFSMRSPLISVFDYTLAVFIDSGIYHYWQKTHDYGMHLKFAFWKLNDISSALCFEDILPAFLATFYGLILSIIVFVIELIVHKISHA